MVSKQRRLSAFFGQQHKEETAETSTASKLPKWNFEQSWLETYKWLKFDPPKGMLCLLCQKSKKQNPFTVGCANYRTSTLVHNTQYIRIKKYKVKKIVTPPPQKKKTKCPSKINWLEHIAPQLEILDQHCVELIILKRICKPVSLSFQLWALLWFFAAVHLWHQPHQQPVASHLFSHQVVAQPFVEVMLIVASASVFCYFVYVWIPYLFRVGPINREEITNATKTMLT